MRIRSHNNNGFSVWSSPQVFTTICDIPNQVSYHWIYCIPDSNKIELNWLKPEENGKPIEYYEIEVYKSSHEVYKTEKTKLETHIITDLQPRTQYRLRIRSFSEIGYSDWSEFLEVTTSRIILPEKIQDIRCVKIQPRELVFEWSEAKTRGLAIDYYEIEMGNENNNQLQNVQDLTYTFSNLNPGNRYVFRVRAHNKQGFGEWSKSLNVSTNTSEPDPIPNLSPRHVAANQIEMTWEKPEDNGSNITLYELEISSPLQKDPEIQKTTRKRFRIPNLRPNTFYDIRVRAQSDHGPSEWSEVVTVKTKKSKPEKIERVWITNRSLTQAELVWEPPKDNGDSIDFYQIEMNDSKTFAPVSSLTSSRTRAARRRALALDPDLPEFHQLFGDMSPKQRLSKMLMRLQSDTEYKIRIRAHNKHGFSEWSGYSQFTLTLLETLKVDEIFCQSHSTRIDLNWNIPQYRRDEIEFYEIEYFSFSLLQNHNILQADERNDSPIPTISSLHIQDEQVDLDEDLTDTPAYRSCVNENVIQLNRSYENHKTLDGLDPEQVYEIRIRAYDPSLGFGSWSSFHAFETLAQEPDPRPDAVQLIFPGKESENRSSKTRPFSPAFDSITNRSIAGVPNAIDEVHGFFDQVTEPKNLILSWKEPANNGGPVDKYIVEISGKIVLETFDTHINIVRLKASINHTFRIRAHNRFGFGQWFVSKKYLLLSLRSKNYHKRFDLPTAIKFSKYDPNDDLYICYIGNKEIKIKLLSNSNKSKEKKGEQFNLFVLENGNFIHFFNYVLDIFEEEKTVLQSPKKESFSEINPRRNSSQHRTKSNNQQQDSRKQNPLKLRSGKHVPKITRPKNKNHQEEMKAKKTKKDGRKKKHKPQKKMEKFSRNLVDNQPQIEKSEEVKKEKRQKSTTYQNPSPLPNKVKFQSLPKLPTLENARIDFNQHHSKKDN
ncbi:fibronectin type iii domain-containing 3ba-related [Anaeramoeba ignava]|uniref:Fibronectin type iii domain-containing 3ba-related n=1 Tax=Anaeramoeba ignava TaxID=1746090 RepID=A0A9Q0L6S8_ANAIG|nr:fibronectin type iii domain-containing 3ba-related [Anaeramoeba ignava]